MLTGHNSNGPRPENTDRAGVVFIASTHNGWGRPTMEELTGTKAEVFRTYRGLREIIDGDKRPALVTDLWRVMLGLTSEQDIQAGLHERLVMIISGVDTALRQTPEYTDFLQACINEIQARLDVSLRPYQDVLTVLEDPR